MAQATKPVLFCWSGGKDSAMALSVLRQQKELRVAALLTTVTEGCERVSMHRVRRSLLLRQAHAIGLPRQEGRIPPQCVNPVYEAPIFSDAIPVERGEVVERDGFYFCDLKEKAR